MQKLIKKEDKIGEIIRNFPQTADVFYEFGLFCVGCPASEYESIEDGLKAHGKTKKETTQLIKKLNKILKK